LPELIVGERRLHYVVTGVDDPITMFVPGLAQSIADTRPFGSGIRGSRVFVDIRGHGGSSAPASDDGWTYAELADDVRRVADEVGATRALGVSLGAGALVRLLAHSPDRFERVVLALPGPLTEPRADDLLAVTDALADAVSANDPVAIGKCLALLQPESARNRADVSLWARRHAAEIGGTAVAGALRAMPRQRVLNSLDALAAVSAPVLVLAQRDDVVHPLASAQQLAAALPNPHLEVSDVPWIWGGRSALRDVVSRFLS
jgi:pimeloyl-ACP methyl ester carboxylesterase